MISLSNYEKKVMYVLAVIFVLCVFEYTLFTLDVISSNVEDFLTILILGAVSIYIYNQPRARYHTKDRLLGYYFIWLLVCGIVFVIIYFGCGFLFGFGNNPYRQDAIGRIKNLLIFGSIIVLKEWIRNFVVNKVDKKNLFLYALFLIIMFTAIQVNILDVFDATNIEELTIIVSQRILPIVALNIFLTYVCYVTGYLPAILYMLVTNIPIWFFDSLPNLEWIVTAIIGIAFPMIALVSLMETVNKHPSSRSKRVNNEPKAKNVILWVFVGGFCILISFFTAGLFKIYPTVLVSGSMSPTINRGDVVIVEQVDSDSDVEVSDIIMFNTGKYDVVHRVVEIKYVNGAIKYITKGDDNEKADSLDIEIRNISGVVIAKIPYLGFPRLMFENAQFEDEINAR